MGYQFIHIEGYARVGSVQRVTDKKTGEVSQIKKWSVADIAAEAERKDGACDHVESPKPPRILYGCGPSEAAQLAAFWADGVKDGRGRKMRSDGLCLLAGVVSLGAERSEDWPRFREAAIEELKQKYGARLVSVIEHTDEAHPHLHFYAVPLQGESFDVLHPGRKAAAEIARQGAKKGAQNGAYIDAMREYQDSFYRAVAGDFGLARLGPARRRLKRDEWLAEKAAGAALAKQLVSIDVSVAPADVAPQVVGRGALGLKQRETADQVAARLRERRSW